MTQIPKKGPIPLASSKHSPRPFLQPIAVALVSLILVSLALAAGFMDLRNLDKTLTGHIKKRGIDIIGSIQQAAAHNFHLLGHMSRSHRKGFAGAGLAEEGFYLREGVMSALMELAQRIDFEREEGRLDNAALASLADSQGIWVVALLDKEGRVSYENRPTPEPLLASAGRVIRGEDWIVMDFLGRFRQGSPMGFLGLRRKWGNGAIILALNPEGFLFWGARVSIEQAVEDVGLGTDAGYFTVTDRTGRTLYQSRQLTSPAESERMEARQPSEMVEVTLPFRLDKDADFTARLALSRDTADQLLAKEEQRAFVFTGFMVLIALLSMAFLYRNQSKHLASMREMERRLHRAERLSAMGRLAAGVAHEIRNPLNAISMATQRLKEENLTELTGIIRDEIRRLNHIVEEFIDFARSAKPVRKETDLAGLLSQMAMLVEEETASKGITLQTDLPASPLTVWMDADKMRQALFNIIRNATESIPDRGTVTISAGREGKHRAVIRISDTGVGIASEETDKIFDPGHTTKEQGLGLGLALAHEIIQAHNGDIRVASEPEKGATFEIRLPVGGDNQ